jgi:predicted transcriptional regulator
MNEMQTTVERHFQLSPERARRLDSLARTRGVAESQIVENALDILFSLADTITQQAPLRNHSAFLKGYAPEDEGLYDGYPSR